VIPCICILKRDFWDIEVSKLHGYQYSQFRMKVENLHIVSSQKESIEGDVGRGAETICRRIMRGHVNDGVAIGLVVAVSTIEIS